MFGGFGARLLNELHLYKIGENKWKLIKTSGLQPSPRCYHTQFYQSPYLYIYAGQGEKGRSLGDMYMLNLESENMEWKRVFLVDPPTPRHQYSLSSFKEGKDPISPYRKYLFGGITTPDNILYNEVWLLENEKIRDESSNTIEGVTVKPISTTGIKPSKRKGHSAFCYQTSLYIFGGETIDFKEPTTDKIFILDVKSTWSWTSFDCSLAKISSRGQFSTTWLNDDNLLFFGGLENETATGLKDLIYLDLKNMHFSFPFAAGEYPEARYGHATCNYTANNQENLMLLGGINNTFCTMDIYELIEIDRKEGQTWEKIIQKTKYEEKISAMASTFAFEARTHNLSLKDLIMEERTKGIKVKEVVKKAEQEYKDTEKKWQRRLDKRDDRIEQLDQENEELCK